MKQLNPKAVWLFYLSNVLSWAFFLVVIYLISLFAINFFSTLDAPNSFVIFAILGKIITSTTDILTLAIIVVLNIILFLWAFLTYNFYKYELTNDSFKKEHGIIWKKYVTIPYGRIQNVDIYRGLLARILGLSDLQIQTAGMSTAYGSYGAGSEGRLPGVSKQEAEKLRDELIKRAKKNDSDV